MEGQNQLEETNKNINKLLTFNLNKTDLEAIIFGDFCFIICYIFSFDLQSATAIKDIRSLNLRTSWTSDFVHCLTVAWERRYIRTLSVR